jgi:hypothetical protein
MQMVSSETLRADFTHWLCGAAQEACIDSYRGMCLRIMQIKADPASNYGAWFSKHCIGINSEGVREEQSDSACFNDDDVFWVSNPYCKVGHLLSALY